MRATRAAEYENQILKFLVKYCDEGVGLHTTLEDLYKKFRSVFVHVRSREGAYRCMCYSTFVSKMRRTGILLEVREICHGTKRTTAIGLGIKNIS